MFIYVVLVLFIVGINGTIQMLRIPEEKKKLAFLIISGLTLVSLATLRGPDVGTDTQAYWNSYMLGRTADFLSIFTEWGENHAYYWLSGLLSNIGVPRVVWFGLIAAFSTGTVFYLIYRFSKSPMLSVLMYLAVGSFAFSMAGLKQTIAMTFAVWAYFQLRERHFFRFLLLVGIGSLFHVTVLVFLLAYPLSYIKSAKIQVGLYAVAVLLAFLNATPILRTVLELLNNEHYTEYLDRGIQYSLTSFTIQFFILVLCLFFYKNVAKLGYESEYLFTMAFLGLTFQAYASTIADLFRLSLYFADFSIILLPNCLCSEKDEQSRRVLLTGSAFAFTAYFLYSVSGDGSISPYSFCW